MAGATTGTTLVLLDTNAYLRLAKRVRPLLGNDSPSAYA